MLHSQHLAFGTRRTPLERGLISWPLWLLVACGGGTAAPPEAGAGTADAPPQLEGVEPAEDVVADIPVQQGPPPLEGRPDILLVTVDTLRVDHLGYAGYFRDTSPNVDRLAQESVRFNHCLAPMATTLPTHTSLLTGVWPIEHGVLANFSHGGQRFERSAKLFSVAEFLQSNGYSTAAFVSGLPLKKDFGLADGFDYYSQPPKRAFIAATNTSRVLKWLKEQEELDERAPFFIWVHYFDPHGPYEPPPDYLKKFAGTHTAERAAYVEERKFSLDTKRPGVRAPQLMTLETIDAYDAEIAYTDAEFGRLIDSLRARERWSETIVIFAADHGEGLGQHDFPGHGQTWNEQLHVPLLMRIPGFEGCDVSESVSLVDVLPTLLGRIDLPDEERLGRQLSGRDLFASEPRAVLSQTSGRQHKLLGGMHYALVSQGWKLRRELGGAVQLFHLERDPFELEDVSAEHADVVAKLGLELDLLLDKQKGRAEYFANAGMRSGQAGSLTAEELESMKALGYGGDEDDEDDEDDDGQ